MCRFLTLIAILALTVVGCSQEATQGSGGSNPSRPADYGNNPRLDNLYDACAGGDATACENLYLEAPVNSEYESFAIQQGGAESFQAPPETTVQAPEPEQVSIGETFELRGFEWNIGEVSVEDGWTNPESFGGEQLDGAFLLERNRHERL